MKKGLKIVIGIVIGIYLVLVVFTTAFLLNKNDYGVSKFFGRYLVINEEKTLEDYEQGSLLIIKPVEPEDVAVGDKAFFYDTYSVNKKIKYAEVIRKEKINENETTFTMKDNSPVSGQYVLGTKKSTIETNFFGKILNVVQSRWGFLFIVVFPLFLALIYEVYAIYKEFKKK